VVGLKVTARMSHLLWKGFASRGGEAWGVSRRRDLAHPAPQLDASTLVGHDAMRLERSRLDTALGADTGGKNKEPQRGD